MPQHSIELMILTESVPCVVNYSQFQGRTPLLPPPRNLPAPPPLLPSHTPTHVAVFCVVNLPTAPLMMPILVCLVWFVAKSSGCYATSSRA